MRKTAIIITALILCLCGAVKADTSYLLLQSPSGTFKFAINYTAGTLTSGFDLLTAALNSTQLDSFGYSGTDGIGYGAFVSEFTLEGTTLTNTWTSTGDDMNDDYSGYGQSWTYYTANAGASSWNYASFGTSSRNLSDGSFDAWIYGYTESNSDGFSIIIPTASGVAPTPSDFSDAVQVEAVPEPGSIALVLAGGAVVLAFRRKLRKS